jgi:hypothetical protein
VQRLGVRVVDAEDRHALRDPVPTIRSTSREALRVVVEVDG